MTYVARRTSAGTLVRCAILLALLICGRAARAQTISVSGNPGLLNITSAVAGSEPIAVSNAATTYTVSTPNINRTFKITAQLNANMPAGMTLTATLAAPTQATSVGAVPLDVTARDVVTGIRKNANATRSITYQLTATAAAGVVPLSSRVVTFTVLAFP